MIVRILTPTMLGQDALNDEDKAAAGYQVEFFSYKLLNEKLQFKSKSGHVISLYTDRDWVRSGNASVCTQISRLGKFCGVESRGEQIYGELT